MVTIATMQFEEYKHIEHSAPYVLHLEGKAGVGLLHWGHHRAFAVVGASHVVMQEPALRAAFAEL